METIVNTSQVTANVKQRKHHEMLIHGFSESEELAIYAWVDAANADRPDGGSTQGIFAGLGPKSTLKAAIGCISAMAWHYSKMDRVCRSSQAAEALAVNGEDALFCARYQWSELQEGVPDVRDSCAVVQSTPGCLVTDSTNVYDKLNTEVIVVKGAERRTYLGLLMGLKESHTSPNLFMRWVHSSSAFQQSDKGWRGREIELYY